MHSTHWLQRTFFFCHRHHNFLWINQEELLLLTFYDLDILSNNKKYWVWPRSPCSCFGIVGRKIPNHLITDKLSATSALSWRHFKGALPLVDLKANSDKTSVELNLLRTEIECRKCNCSVVVMLPAFNMSMTNIQLKFLTTNSVTQNNFVICSSSLYAVIRYKCIYL